MKCIFTEIYKELLHYRQKKRKAMRQALKKNHYIFSSSNFVVNPKKEIKFYYKMPSYYVSKKSYNFYIAAHHIKLDKTSWTYSNNISQNVRTISIFPRNRKKHM